MEWVHIAKEMYRNGRLARTKVRRRSMLEKFQDGDLKIADIRATLLQCAPVGRTRDGRCLLGRQSKVFCLLITNPTGIVHIEKAITEEHHDSSAHWGQRMLYAIDLETSMRGVGVRAEERISLSLNLRGLGMISVDLDYSRCQTQQAHLVTHFARRVHSALLQ